MFNLEPYLGHFYVYCNEYRVNRLATTTITSVCSCTVFGGESGQALIFGLTSLYKTQHRVQAPSRWPLGIDVPTVGTHVAPFRIVDGCGPFGLRHHIISVVESFLRPFAHNQGHRHQGGVSSSRQRVKPMSGSAVSTRERRTVTARRETLSKVPSAPKKASANYSKPEAGTEETQQTRTCLTCGRSFTSEWAGERICRRCKSSSTWRQG